TRFSRDWSSDVCSSDLPSVCKIDKGWKQIWRGSAFAVDAADQHGVIVTSTSVRIRYKQCSQSICRNRLIIKEYLISCHCHNYPCHRSPLCPDPGVLRVLRNIAGRHDFGWVHSDKLRQGDYVRGFHGSF